MVKRRLRKKKDSFDDDAQDVAVKDPVAACAREIDAVLKKWGCLLVARADLVMQDNGTYAVAARPALQPRNQVHRGE